VSFCGKIGDFLEKFRLVSKETQPTAKFLLSAEPAERVAGIF
jgi:hypothetical protein